MYNHQLIEKKWQERWLKDNVWNVSNVHSHLARVHSYVLDMFPYPSGAGLHVGHPKGYTATDIYTRYLRMKGRSVLHPMGWDAFGLPAENYAIKQGVPPAVSTNANIEIFRRQIQSLGLSYDWSREVNTSSPDYYHWTQWMFLFLYKHGLAYKKKAPVNWCASCQTVLAHEQVIDGACERCNNKVVQRELEQWFLNITEYADRLIEGLDRIDWPEPIRVMQKNWIGKSEGAMIGFAIKCQLSVVNYHIDVFTTRPDTLYGATYLVLAPEHEFVRLIVETGLTPSLQNANEIRLYVENAQKKTELERTQLQKEKTGVELKGAKAINPATGKEIPIWVADYVIGSYGTGAIMAVPAHDERDFEFAEKYGLPVRSVVETSRGDVSDSETLQRSVSTATVYTGDGIMINSAEFDGMNSEEAKWKITEKVGGKRVTQYRLRDWLISRQRYWGAPIPIVYCQTCGQQPVPEDQLPVMLPTDVDFKPHGESPLAQSKDFQKNVVCPQCGGTAKREVDTMDTFMCSAWYYLRFCDPQNEKEFASQEAIKQWMPVDTYVGGAEHAVLHLMYARFAHKALFDHGMIPKEVGDEPFIKLRNVGLVLAEDGRKMSKSLGNVINPDDLVKEYGADSVRMYEMFMGPFEDALPWASRGIVGMRRFLDRVYQLYLQTSSHPSPTLGEGAVAFPLLPEEGVRGRWERVLHKTIKKVTEDIENMRFNTAISALMICLHEWEACVPSLLSKESSFRQLADGGEVRSSSPSPFQGEGRGEVFLKLLFPFAPHIAQEIWSEVLHQEGYLDTQPWPEYDEALIKDETITIAVQINGKVRGQIAIPTDITEEEAIIKALQDIKIQKWISGKDVVKKIYVPGKVINMVVQ
ncbi:MAG: Leucine-tRNA ligase [Parcubacteria group bacterium GW2011_GWA2_43_13]|nr:MAG: Leucine-tRNA ligase [Parcubacteria group bacterium GW2011_GWA2_43_13]OGY69142.1 MAG: leucine--tRNA ligase [Candidatus Jacksonbacteria bacterium RIFCSPHIGHO2_02_FULL_43_10]OGY70161.1 MAG: leucine--tRNA ligase [Candidatus Jacksonbacteria bacterium RIFCSPLOWO2_01_FULL_44_13]HAZ16725.1 leucine--tRNA ligase [Candidatus Jacksonbacteria bacterium]